MNRMFQNCLDKLIIVFIDDILMFSMTHEKHKEYLRFTLQRLKKKQLYPKVLKHEFQFNKVTFFRHVVLTKIISINLSKIEVVLNQQRLKIVKEVQSFLGLVGYYKRFIEGFTRLARSLTTFIKNGTQFQDMNLKRYINLKLYSTIQYINDMIIT